MTRRGRFTSYAMALAVMIGASVLAATPAVADTVWTDWTSAVSGSAAGVVNGIEVSYAGQVIGQTVIDGTASNWSPNGSFIGGSVVRPLPAPSGTSSV